MNVLGRLRLAIADSDEAYVDSLVNFLISNYSLRFQINSFTRRDCLNDFLLEEGGKVDVLLISRDIFSDSLPVKRAGTVILLADGRRNIESEAFPVVNKFQHGDRLVSNVMNIISDRVFHQDILIERNDRAKIIAVYSPAGGVGKTYITVSSCIRCSQTGMKVFYLNLEEMNSTRSFFDCNSEQNLSNIFFHVKEKSKNLHLKMEGIKCIDSQFNVHFFSPPDSNMEKEDMLPEEAEQLVGCLRQNGDYDLIFIDLSSSFNRINLKLLEMSDEILLIAAPEEMVKAKLKILETEIKKLVCSGNGSISNKVTVILNKYMGEPAVADQNFEFMGISAEIVLPYSEELQHIKETKQLAAPGSCFYSGISGLVGRYAKNRDSKNTGLDRVGGYGRDAYRRIAK